MTKRFGIVRWEKGDYLGHFLVEADTKAEVNDIVLADMKKRGTSFVGETRYQVIDSGVIPIKPDFTGSIVNE